MQRNIILYESVKDLFNGYREKFNKFLARTAFKDVLGLTNSLSHLTFLLHIAEDVLGLINSLSHLSFPLHIAEDVLGLTNSLSHFAFILYVLPKDLVIDTCRSLFRSLILLGTKFSCLREGCAVVAWAIRLLLQRSMRTTRSGACVKYAVEHACNTQGSMSAIRSSLTSAKEYQIQNRWLPRE